MSITIGTCSLCGGRVSVSNLCGTLPPIPRCDSCGATKKNPFGRIVEMEPNENIKQPYSTMPTLKNQPQRRVYSGSSTPSTWLDSNWKRA